MATLKNLTITPFFAMTTRRDVLKRLSAVAIGGASLSAPFCASAFGATSDTDIPAHRFYAALKELEPAWSLRIDPIARNNFYLSWDAIAPKTLHEYMFATWCALRSNSGHWIAEEFARRRSGYPSRRPDHPVFEIDQHLYQNWRIPVYREQSRTVLSKVTGYTGIDLLRLEKMIMRRKFHLNDFSSIVTMNTDQNRDLVLRQDFLALWMCITMTIRSALPLGYIKSLTARAIEAVLTERFRS